MASNKINLYSIKTAAERLGVNAEYLKHHIWKSGVLKDFGTLVSGRIIFVEDELAGMKAALDKVPPPGPVPLGSTIADHHERQDLALQMREEGKPWADIASELGYSFASAARRAAYGAMERRDKAKGKKRRG